MNELEDILGIKFPSNCEVSSVTNTSKKVKRNGHGSMAYPNRTSIISDQPSTTHFSKSDSMVQFQFVGN